MIARTDQSDLESADVRTSATFVEVPRPIRIALVDDEESVHQLVRRIFEKHRPEWTLDGYIDGRNALAKIPHSPPDAVVMDISMPGLPGVECVKNLKSILPKLPIVMLSAHVEPETLFDAMTAGACGCLHKPISAEDLFLALKKTLAVKGSPIRANVNRQKSLRSQFLFF
jgi:DNA-binding NarL/FixJ family response regulator